MIRRIRPGNRGLRRRKALRKYEVKGGIRKAATPRGELLVPTNLILQNRSGIQHQSGNREFESHPLRHLGFEFQLAITDLQEQEVRYDKCA